MTKAKEFCSNWNMKIFFQVVHDDMEKCLEHLNDLRLPGELKNVEEQKTAFAVLRFWVGG